MRSVSQTELQQDLQRFQGRFSAWLADAADPLMDDPDPQIRRAAMDLQVRFSSAALDIALGPETDTNLLDMVTFVELARTTVTEHWVPAVFRGKQATAFADVLHKAGEDVWQVARKVLTEPEEGQLRRIIDRWKAEHPEQMHISAMRLPGFANPVESGFGSMNAEATGLFAGVKKAVQSADQVRLLGERALFAAQRMPFLIRAQTRLASQQMLADVRTDLAPTLATARRALKGALLLSVLVGMGLLIYLPLARR